MITVLIKIVNIILEIIYLPLKLLPTQKKITFISRQSNVESVDISMIKNEIFREIPDCKVVVLTKMVPDNVKGKVLYVFHMLTQMYHIATSRIVILDTYCIVISLLHHKRSLTVIQMWHALGLMKKAGYSILNKPEGRSYSLAMAMKLHKNYDIIFASSEECRQAIGEVFGYPRDVVKNFPLPRVDLIRDSEYIDKKKKEIFEKYPQLCRKKNVLYAPTFRKDETELEEQVKNLVSVFPYEQYNLILNLHPLSKVRVMDSRVISDASFSTMEMLTVSDYVISDYSSIVYEAAIMKKSLIFYAFDLDTYQSDREFFIDYMKEVPGPICKSADEIADALLYYPYSIDRINAFAGKYVDVSVESCTERIVKLLKERL